MSLSVSQHRPRRTYPTPARVRAFVSAAQQCGISVGGFEVTPDGNIRIYDAAVSDKAKAQNDFDRWEGQL